MMNVDVESDGESSDSRDTNNGLEIAARTGPNVAPFSINNTMEAPPDSTFDLTLPATHSYLGNNLEELRGRTILDDGIYMNLPLLVKQSIIFPGQTLPMTIFDKPTIDMLQKCIQSDRTFGVVCLNYNEKVPIGTTAEIYQYMEGNEAEGFRVKAKGRQRFKILQVIEGYGKRSANVKILPEITLGHPFLDARLASLDNLRLKPKNLEEERKLDRIERMDAAVTPWPSWVYKQYDPRRLSLKIRQYLQFIETRGSNIPEDPVELSFWIPHNLLLDDSQRIMLLNYDCAISRLQRELAYLVKDRIFECRNCSSMICKQSDMFPMSKEGPQSAYCNLGGVIHETITVYKAYNLVQSREPASTEYSWFPGYAWTIALCTGCGMHIGWLFTAVQKGLRPEAVWGLTRKSLRSRTRRNKRRSESPEY